MKKVFISITIVAMTFAILTDCTESDVYLEQKCEDLWSEIATLNEQKALIETEIVDVKEANGTAKYVVTFRM